MLKKHAILIALSIGALLLVVSTFYYPGGSNENLNSEGYDWLNNYISNLLRPLAVNGEPNSSRLLATIGVLFLTSGFGVFFIQFSSRIKIKSAAFVIRYLGILATTLGFIIVVPALHDKMVMLSSALTLLIFFYITIMVLKSKLTMFKILSVLFLLSFYGAAYMYFTESSLEYMPLVQKIIFLVKIIWVLSLHYGTSKEDFAHIVK